MSKEWFNMLSSVFLLFSSFPGLLVLPCTEQGSGTLVEVETEERLGREEFKRPKLGSKDGMIRTVHVVNR